MKTATALCLTGLLGCAQAFVAPQFSVPAAPHTRVSARGVVKMENFNLPLGEVCLYTYYQQGDMDGSIFRCGCV